MKTIERLKKMLTQKNQLSISEIEIRNGYLAMNNEDILKLITAKRDFYRDKCANFLQPEDQHYFKVYDSLIRNVQKHSLSIEKTSTIDGAYNEKASGVI